MAVLKSSLIIPSNQVQRASFHNLLVLKHGKFTKSQKYLSLLPFHGRFTCEAIASKLSDQKQRRSANYEPPYWNDEQLQSLVKNNENAGQMFKERSNVLKEQVKLMMLQDDDGEELNRLRQLELIDDLQRLGIFYHFEDQIQSILRRIHNENSSSNILPNKKGLYETALEFRLLRQHNFHVPQEVFDCFMCERGVFKGSLDTKGLLYLYEASFLLTENDSTLELAREFTTKNLKRILEENKVDEELASLVRHALELPLHWRMLRLEARWFIDLYQKRPDMNPTLLELAKLDFNILQATYQIDLDYTSRWWKSTGFGERFTFARDRLVENFFWSIGVNFYPEYGYFRRILTKIIAWITTLDDIYDVYGTLDELELFTDAVERWDINAIDQLPDYMKIYYHEFYNSINEMAYETLKEQDVYILPCLRKLWKDLCEAYLQEAKWYYEGHIPALEGYLNNAWISAAATVILVHAYFLVCKPIKKEALMEYLDGHHNIIRCSAMILRLSNDLGTSSEEMKRGDVSKSIKCYMNENNISEEDAREYIKLLIRKMWKEMNFERAKETPISKTFIEMAMNMGRTAQCMYENGDGYGHQDFISRERISAILFEPIHFPKA